MNSVVLVIMLYTSQAATEPRDIIRVPLPGATVEQCHALRSAIKVMSTADAPAWAARCEVPEAEGLRV